MMKNVLFVLSLQVAMACCMDSQNSANVYLAFKNAMDCSACQEGLNRIVTDSNQHKIVMSQGGAGWVSQDFNFGQDANEAIVNFHDFLKENLQDPYKDRFDFQLNPTCVVQCTKNDGAKIYLWSIVNPTGRPVMLRRTSGLSNKS